MSDWFQDDEEEKQTPVPPEERPMDSAVKDYLMKKHQEQPSTTNEPSLATRYSKMASDDTEVEQARKDAAKKNMWLGIIQGASGSNDNGFYGGLHDQVNQRAKEAESKKQKELEGVLTQDKLSRQDVMRQREDSKWERSENEAKLAADPTSSESQLAQKIATKMLPGQDFSKHTAAQIYKALPFVERQVSNSIQQRKLEQADERLGLGREGLTLRTEKEERLGEQFKVGQGNRMQDEVVKTIQMARGTETWKSAEKTLSNVPTMRNLLADAYKQGGQSLSMLGPQVAKGIAGEVGILTDKDVTLYVQNPALVPGMMDTIAKITEGKVSEVSYENLNRLLDIAEKSAREKMDLALKNEAELYSRRRQGMSQQDAQHLIDPTFQKPGVQAPAPAPTQPATAPALDQDQTKRAAKIQEYKKDYPDYTDQEIEEFLIFNGVIKK